MNWSQGNITKFWNDEYTKLNYTHEVFNNQQDIMRWRREGYVHPTSHYTGLLCDMRSPQPSWNLTFIDWFTEKFKVQDVGTSYYRMGTGVILPLHGDTYVKYRRLFNCNLADIHRVIVFLEDWRSGHYFEIDGVPVINWNAGDYVHWIGDIEHMAANIGLDKRYTLQLTGHK